MDELDIISTENKAIYEEIKDFAHTLEKRPKPWWFGPFLMGMLVTLNGENCKLH